MSVRTLCNAVLCCGLAVLCALAGCAGRGEANLQPGAPLARSGPGQPAGLPPVPADRLATTLTQYALLGKDAQLFSPGASPSGNSLLLTSGASSTEYAIYRFNVPSAPDNVQLSFGAATSAAWVGLADYTTQHWQLAGPFTTGQILALHAANVSPLGNISIAVLAPTGASAAVDLVQVFAANLPPTAGFSATPPAGKAQEWISFDASASADPDGSIVLYEWDFDNDGQYEVDNGNQPVVQHKFDSAGNYPVSLRVTDPGGDGDVHSATIVVGPPNQAPTAALTATPDDGPAPLSVVLDASASSDPDGTIVNYAWDLDDDGSFEIDGGAVPTLSPPPFSTLGPHTVGVRVTDDNGAVDATTASLNVSGWLKVPVDAPGVAGGYTSLAVINGFPAMCYTYNVLPDIHLKYAYSSEPDGSSGWTALDVDAGGGKQVGADCSLAEVNGKPAISYQDQTDQDLRYAYSSTADGSSGWSHVDVDTATNTGFCSSLAVVAGKPAISYWDESTFHPRYAWSSQADGSSGWQSLTVDSAFTSASTLSLHVIDGHPAMCYSASGIGLRFARSSQPDGSSGWSAVTVDGTGTNVGMYTSLTTINGFPAISYYDMPNTNVKYAYSTDPDGATGWTSLTLDGAAGDAGAGTSLLELFGYPAVAYTDTTNGTVRLATTTTSDGSSGWTSAPVDQTNAQTSFPSLCIVDGYAAIACHDSTTQQPVYLVLYD